MQKRPASCSGSQEQLGGRAGTGTQERLSEQGLRTSPPLVFRLGHDRLVGGWGLLRLVLSSI